jgi:pimeloyl-ACP methyl ester carboxylesterase
VTNPVRGALNIAARVVLTAALVAGCAAAPSAGHPVAAATGARRLPASATPAPVLPLAPPPVTLAGYYAQKLFWQPCAQGFQCARLLVPFDYNRPSERRFSLPVIRLPATDPGQRIGSLVVNPGGPGGSGVSYALQARSVIPAAVRARFDVVGFDPRGVGGSEPAVHCITGPQLDKYYETDDTPANPGQLASVVSESRLFASGCERDSGALLPYVGTPSAARDMDVLRAALGDSKLSYLGKSYGTYLGTWYAQLFPAHVRALVLDGAIDPAASSLGMNIVQGEGFEVALRSFAANCMARTDCPLGHGGNVSAGLARLQALITRATSHPLISNLGDGRPANGALLLNGVVSALYSRAAWPTLRSALQAAFTGDGTILVELGDLLYQRGPGGTYSNLADANMAVDCLDRPWPRGLAAWSSAAAAAAKVAPQFGQAIMWGSLPCAYWPVPSPALPAIRAAGAPPILVVGNKRDPATPYRWAVALAGDMASGVLLGWNGDGHTAYMMGSSCVDGIVNQYLLSLATPSSGTLCP